MDSSGVHTLLAAERRCLELGTRLVLVRGHAAIERVMAMCGLEGRFETVADPGELFGRPALA